jgi:hypothetical protein
LGNRGKYKGGNRENIREEIGELLGRKYCRENIR